jgi:hypothetical protein
MQDQAFAIYAPDPAPQKASLRLRIPRVITGVGGQMRRSDRVSVVLVKRRSYTVSAVLVMRRSP